MLFSIVSGGTWFVSTFVMEPMGRTATDYKYVACVSGPSIAGTYETIIKEWWVS